MTTIVAPVHTCHIGLALKLTALYLLVVIGFTLTSHGAAMPPSKELHAALVSHDQENLQGGRCLSYASHPVQAGPECAMCTRGVCTGSAVAGAAAAGTAASGSAAYYRNHAYLKHIHGWLLGTAFIFLMPLAILISRGWKSQRHSIW